MILNGEKMKINSTTVAMLLKEHGYCANRVAVELNGEIISRSNFENTEVKNDDTMEVVMFMGGGCQ